MADDQIAVSAHGVSKDFMLPTSRKSSLKERVLSFERSKFEHFHALENVNFEVKKGEFFGILGRNGSGKSTMLKLIGGIYQPTHGKIHINGTLTPFIELGIGFNPELTGRENVFLNGAILGLPRREVEQKYDEIVGFAQLERFMDQKLKNYSSGMQVRLAFSIAIQAHNDILLIDEVLAVGDQIFQEKCFDEFRKIKKSSKTVIFVSHDLGSVERFCDRVMILDQGKVVDTGSAKSMVLRYGSLLADQQFDEQAKGSKYKYNDSVDTGKVVITGTEILSDGKVKKHLTEGHPFTIRTHFTVKNSDPKGYVFGVSVMDHNEVSLIAPNTSENNFKIVDLPNEGYIDATFATNPLSSGNYSINAAFFNPTQTLAHSFERGILRFRVVGKGRHGIISLEPKWQVGSKKSGSK